MISMSTMNTVVCPPDTRAKLPSPPDYVGSDIFFGAEEFEHADYGVGNVAYHHTHYKEGDIALYFPCHKSDYGHYKQRTDNGRHGYRYLA